MTNVNTTRGKYVAIVAGVFSIAIAVIYLVLIFILDSRGAMMPPPPEALGFLQAASFSPSQLVQLLCS